jgi:hypothetical protein
MLPFWLFTVLLVTLTVTFFVTLRYGPRRFPQYARAINVWGRIGLIVLLPCIAIAALPPHVRTFAVWSQIPPAFYADLRHGSVRAILLAAALLSLLCQVGIAVWLHKLPVPTNRAYRAASWTTTALLGASIAYTWVVR